VTAELLAALEAQQHDNLTGLALTNASTQRRSRRNCSQHSGRK
jgi:hypothetical protein